MTISVLGAGSWGSALAIALNHVAPVTLWGRDEAHMCAIESSRTNVGYLPAEVKFPPSILATSNLESAILGHELIVIATPLSGLRPMLQTVCNYYPQNKPDIIWVCKGLEAKSGLFPHQIVQSEFGVVDNIGALLGPSFASEVARSLPTAITLTSSNNDFAKKWIKRFSVIPDFRVYANTDVIGSEVGAAVKNIMAIASGISDGLSLGNNARAALITRSLNELASLVIALGGSPNTIYGLTGIGDLILTCTGDLSRNRTVGLELARGKNLDTILQDLGHVAEGVYAAREIYNLSQKLQLNMPITTAVYQVLYCNVGIKSVITDLLNREPKFELT